MGENIKLPPPPTKTPFKDEKTGQNSTVWTTWLFNLYRQVQQNMSSDFLFDVAAGRIAGHSLVHKFGRNDSIPNGSFAKVCLLADSNLSVAAVTTVRIKAGGDAADTAAGAGAREITIQGIDSTLAEVTETIATAGASASSSTSKSWWRVHRMWVSDCGTYGASNTAAITLENTAGTQDFISIGAGEGQTQYAGYTIPTGKTAYFLSALITVDSNKAADIKLMTRENMTDVTPGVSPLRLKNYWDGVAGALIFKPRSPGGPISALTDVWVEAQGSGAVAEVSADFELLLVDNA